MGIVFNGFEGEEIYRADSIFNAMVEEITEYRKEQYKKVAELLKEGLKQKEIADKLDRSKAVVSKIISEMRELRDEKDWFEDIPIPLTRKEREKKIINTLIKNPSISKEELAEKANTHIGNMYKILKEHGGIKGVLKKYRKLPLKRKRIPFGYWKFLETRRLFFKWLTCMFSAAPESPARDSSDIKFLKKLGLKKYDPPSVRFLGRNVTSFYSIYHYFEKKDEKSKLLNDWLEASQSTHVRFLQDCFKVFNKGYVKNGLESEKIYSYKTKSPPKNTKPIYFYVSGRRMTHKLRKKVLGSGLVDNNTFYSARKTLKNLNFLEENREYTILGGRWDKHKKKCYIITLDFEREKFKNVFDGLGVDIWDKPNNDIGL